MSGPVVRRPDGSVLPYETRGRGEPVVLVAGSGTPGRTWLPHHVPALVAAGYRVVTFDHRASGPIPVARVVDVVADLRTLVGALDLAPCRLVGVSLGGRAVLELLVAEPDLADRAVVAAVRGRPDALGRAMAGAERAAAGLRPPPEYEAFQRLVQNLSPRSLEDDATVAGWLDRFETAALTAGGAAPAAEEVPEDRLGAYARVRTPLLVVTFEHDVLTPARLGREIADAVPRARCVELSGCGHLGHLERPEAFDDVVLRFLGDSAAAPHESDGGPDAS